MGDAMSGSLVSGGGESDDGALNRRGEVRFAPAVAAVTAKLTRGIAVTGDEVVTVKAGPDVMVASPGANGDETRCVAATDAAVSVVAVAAAAPVVVVAAAAVAADTAVAVVVTPLMLVTAGVPLWTCSGVMLTNAGATTPIEPVLFVATTARSCVAVGMPLLLEPRLRAWCRSVRPRN
jgi:hypothetical protein